MRISLKNKSDFPEKKHIFNQLHGKAKLRYIWDYYKFPLAILCIVLYVIVYAIYGHFTQKTTILSVAFVNVAPGEALTEQLGHGFLTAQQINSGKNEVRLYTGLYLTDNEDDPNHEYTYASRMKILGAIDGEALDVVLMNKEAFDAFSQNGYLCDLEKLLSQKGNELYQELSPFLQTNTVILKDNSIDMLFDDSIAYSAQTEEYPMGLDISQFPCIKDARLNGTVYLGVIANSPHAAEGVEYVRYLYGK